jgi:hypothetical protein
VKIETAGTNFPRFRGSFANDALVSPANGQRKPHQKSPRCTSLF